MDANWASLGEIAQQCPFGFLPTVIYTILDACLDLFVLLLPIPWIFQLNLSLTNKLSITGCFLLGSIATAAAFVRMTVFIQTGIPSEAMNRTTVMGLPAYDLLGIVSAEVFWTMIESTVALIAVCLPAVRKAVAKSAFGKALGFASFSRMMRSGGSSPSPSKITIRSESPDDNRCSNCSGKIPVGHVVEVSVESSLWDVCVRGTIIMLTCVCECSWKKAKSKSTRTVASCSQHTCPGTSPTSWWVRCGSRTLESVSINKRISNHLCKI